MHVKAELSRLRDCSRSFVRSRDTARAKLCICTIAHTSAKAPVRKFVGSITFRVRIHGYGRMSINTNSRVHAPFFTQAV